MCVFTVFLVPDKIASYVSVRVKQCESTVRYVYFIFCERAVRYVILGKPGILSIHSQYIELCINFQFRDSLPN
jgi:hypothetical protein